jgi:hypothetical protein
MMNGKYVILVRNSPLPPVPVAVESDEFDFGDEPEWEAIEYMFSDNWLSPGVSIVSCGDFERVFLETSVKYGTVYEYGDWNMPWWPAWKQCLSPEASISDRAAAEWASREFVCGLTEVHAQ